MLTGVGSDKWPSQCASLGTQNRPDVLGGLNAIANQPLPASPLAVSYQGIRAYHVVISFGEGLRREAARWAMTKHADDIRIIHYSIYYSFRCPYKVCSIEKYMKGVLFKVTILQKRYETN